MVLQVGSVFPGYAALWPTVCGGLVLLAGRSGSRFGVDRLLASRPMRYLGDISFAPLPVALAAAGAVPGQSRP